MNDILVNHIKLLPLPEDTEKTNRSWLASGGHRAYFFINGNNLDLAQRHNEQ